MLGRHDGCDIRVEASDRAVHRRDLDHGRGVAELEPGSDWISATPAMPAPMPTLATTLPPDRSTELPVVRSRTNSVDDSAARHGSDDGSEKANTTMLTSA